MKVYDVSVVLDSNTHIWDDGHAPRVSFPLHMDRGDDFTVSQFAMSSHSGTHTDAPAHFARGGVTIDRIPADTLVGRAIVVEHAGSEHITAADLDALGIDGSIPRVLFKTATGARWEESGFQRDFIGILPDAAQRLIELGVVLVGIDYLSIEPYEATECPVHKALLGAGVVVVEGLDLRDVPAGEYLLACAPLKLADAEGAPTRVFLIEGSDV